MEKLNVTLIEDEPAVADTVVYALESEGYAVQTKRSLVVNDSFGHFRVVHAPLRE